MPPPDPTAQKVQDIIDTLALIAWLLVGAMGALLIALGLSTLIIFIGMRI